MNLIDLIGRVAGACGKAGGQAVLAIAGEGWAVFAILPVLVLGGIWGARAAIAGDPASR